MVARMRFTTRRGGKIELEPGNNQPIAHDIKKIEWEGRFSPTPGYAGVLHVPAIVMRALGCPGGFNFTYLEAEADIDSKTIIIKIKDKL